jgi:hypothetical protein
MTANTPTTALQLWGAGGFGAIIGWYVYYINRYRREDVQLSDIVTLIGILGGGAILALFPAGSRLFGAYGVGLFTGFFAYFATMLLFVGISKNFGVDWFLDGRRKKPQRGDYIPDGIVVPRTPAMGAGDEDDSEGSAINT